jgi:transposase
MLELTKRVFFSGHRYATILTDITGKRVLDIAENRDTQAVDTVWKALSDKQKKGVKAVSMDFWQAFRTGAETHVPNAVIVHDKFHIMKYLNEAVDAVRKQEHKIFMKNKDDCLKGKKYLFLKNRKDFTKKDRSNFRDLNLTQLDVGRAWNRRELLRNFCVNIGERLPLFIGQSFPLFMMFGTFIPRSQRLPFSNDLSCDMSLL